MKKITLTFLFIIFTLNVYCQKDSLDSYIVGPYEIRYNSDDSSYHYYLMYDTAELYDYFKLKRYTKSIPITNPVFQVDANVSMAALSSTGKNIMWGVDIVRKYPFYFPNTLYFNVGISLAGNHIISGSNETVYLDSFRGFVFGVPLSCEYIVTGLNRNKSSLFASLGLIPAFYATTSITRFGKEADNQNGLLLIPRLDLGGYIQFQDYLIKIGGFVQRYMVNEETNVFKQTGRLHLGASIGIVL
ncbi:MAG: hypothetical protein SPK94_06810 [Bacteroidales bacterium]|nr:hypothetical protein [Bacteroidales bacterium]